MGLPSGSAVKPSPSSAGVVVQFLVKEPRSHMPHDQKTKTEKQKQYCNKFNKMVHIKKKKNLKKIKDSLWEIIFLTTRHATRNIISLHLKITLK